ncbi:MAG: hypothetical protein QXE81_01920 [Desulfurococcaceae archaeon]
MTKKYMGIALFIVFITISASVFSSSNASRGVDCLFLLAVLDKTISYAIVRDPLGEIYARSLLETGGIPFELREYHMYSYEAILRYYELISNNEYNSAIIISKVREIQLNTRYISDYARRLESCSINREAAITLRVSIDLNTKKLEEDLQRITLFYSGSGHEIILLDEYYTPRDEIKLIIPNYLLIDKVEIYSWPSHIKIGEYSPLEYNETHVLFKIHIPSARLLDELGIGSYHRDPLPIALYAKLVNGTYMLIGITRVQYRLPSIVLETPFITKRGDLLEISIISSDFYNATIFLNGQEINRLQITPGSIGVHIDYTLYNYKIGSNDLTICVEPTMETTRYCISRSFIIEPKYPRIRVSAVSEYISWNGFLTLVVNSEDYVNAYVFVESPWGSRYLELPSRGSVNVNLYTGIFPVQVVNYKIKITPINTTYDELVIDNRVLVLNIPIILTLVVLSSLLLPLVSTHERSFMFLIMSSRKMMRQVFEKVEREVINPILKPYKMGLGSQIALLYYGLLKKLRIKQPEISETLREHYIHISKTISNALSLILWRLLLITEQDLYSSKKPSIKEAETLYHGALDAAGEE